MDEFEKESPFRKLIDYDEVDELKETSIHTPTDKYDSFYGKRLEYLQMNPINLLDSKIG